MDTQQAAAATEQAARLRNQISALDTQKQETETKLAEEHAKLRRVALKRGELVESLTGANGAGARAHREIDECDSAIRLAERMTESLQKALSKVANEIQALSAELSEVQQAIETEARAEALRVFKIQLQQAARSAEECLAAARKSLAVLNALGARGAEKFGDPGLRICNPVFEGFVLRESNLDAAGWRPAYPSYTRLEFWIRPMTKG